MTAAQPYLQNALLVVLLLGLLLGAALLLRQAWLRREDAEGAALPWAAFGVTVLGLTVGLYFYLHVDVVSGLIGLAVSAAIVFGGGPDRPRRRRRYRH